MLSFVLCSKDTISMFFKKKLREITKEIQTEIFFFCLNCWAGKVGDGKRRQSSFFFFHQQYESTHGTSSTFNTKGNHMPSMEGSSGYSSVSMATRDVWDRLFDRGYRADVCVNTNNGGVIRVHSIVLVSSFVFFFYVLWVLLILTRPLAFRVFWWEYLIVIGYHHWTSI